MSQVMRLLLVVTTLMQRMATRPTSVVTHVSVAQAFKLEDCKTTIAAASLLLLVASIPVFRTSNLPNGDAR